MKEKLKKLWLLFITTFTTSITANSGYAIVAVLRTKFVEKLKWISEDDMATYVALTQSVPGPVAVNCSVITGYHLAGFPGAMAALLGVCIPPIGIMLLVTLFYTYIVQNEYVRLFMQGMQAGVAAMLVDVTIGLFRNQAKKKSWLLYVLMALSFLYIRFTGLSVFYLALACAAAGIVKVLIVGRKTKKTEEQKDA